MADNWQDWFSSVWEHREDVVYKELFGELNDAFKISAEVFEKGFNLQVEEEFWTANAVLEYKPTDKRNSWLYVSSGLSNPVGQEPSSIDEKGYSGLGFEMLIETKEQSHWPVHLLHDLIAYQVLVACSRIEGEVFDFDQVVPIGKILPNSDLAHVVILESIDGCSYPPGFSLASGGVDLFVLFGMTEDEIATISSKEPSDLVSKYQDFEGFPIIDIHRKSV